MLIRQLINLILFSIARATGDETVAKRFWEQLELQLSKINENNENNETLMKRWSVVARNIPSDSFKRTELFVAELFFYFIAIVNVVHTLSAVWRRLRDVPNSGCNKAVLDFRPSEIFGQNKCFVCLKHDFELETIVEP